MLAMLFTRSATVAWPAPIQSRLMPSIMLAGKSSRLSACDGLGMAIGLPAEPADLHILCGSWRGIRSEVPYVVWAVFFAVIHWDESVWYPARRHQ